MLERMEPRKPSTGAAKASNGAATALPVFNAEAFLDSAGVSKTIAMRSGIAWRIVEASRLSLPVNRFGGAMV